MIQRSKVSFSLSLAWLLFVSFSFEIFSFGFSYLNDSLFLTSFPSQSNKLILFWCYFLHLWFIHSFLSLFSHYVFLFWRLVLCRHCGGMFVSFILSRAITINWILYNIGNCHFWLLSLLHNLCYALWILAVCFLSLYSFHLQNIVHIPINKEKWVFWMR